MNTNRRLAAKTRIFLAAALVASVLAPSLSEAKVFVAIKLDVKDKTPTIPGDATLKGYQGQIEAESLDFGIFSPTGMKPEMADLALVKMLDSASADLALVGFEGRRLPVVEITQVRTGGGKKPTRVFKVTLKGARVSSYRILATADDPASESLTFEYDSIEIETFGADNRGKEIKGGKALLK